MTESIKIEDIQGEYEIAYQSNPPVPNFYEIGKARGSVNGKKMKGVDGFGCLWDAEFEIGGDNLILYNAIVDPTPAPENIVLMASNGTMTRQPQSYRGEMRVTRIGEKLMMRTTIQQGPVTLQVQFTKKV